MLFRRVGAFSQLKGADFIELKEHADLRNVDLSSIIESLRTELETDSKDDPYKDNLFLKWQALWDAVDRFSGSSYYSNFRRASRAECRDACIDYLYEDDGKVSAFHFYETLGLRLTFLVNASNKSANFTAIRRIERPGGGARECLELAAKRLGIIGAKDCGQEIATSD